MTELKWWERLVREAPKENSVICPVCHEKYMANILDALEVSEEAIGNWSHDFSEFLSESTQKNPPVFTNKDIAVFESIAELHNNNISNESIRRALWHTENQQGEELEESGQEDINNPTKKSIDVVCPEDETTLVGLTLSSSRKATIINLLRLSAVGVALAVGYFSWDWTAYIFGWVVIGGFLALFLRLHSPNLRYFLVVGIGSLVAYSIWHKVEPQALSLQKITALLILAVFIPGPIFLVLHTRRAKEDTVQLWLIKRDVELHQHTLLWIAFMLSAAVVSIVAVLTLRVVLPESTEIYSIYIYRLFLFTMGAVIVGALISSIMYTLHGEPFQIDDWLIYRDVMHERKFPHIPKPNDRPPRTWDGKFSKSLNQISKNLTRISNTLARTSVVAINKMIEAVEEGYNHFLIRFVNGLVESAIRLVNFVRRVTIKTVRHLVRSTKRLFIIIKLSISWALYVGTNYFRVFILLPLLYWSSAILLYNMSNDFSQYVHGGSSFLPIRVVAQLLLVLGLLTIGAKQLLRVSFAEFGEKVLNALAVFGINAFLTFLVISWLLGITGWFFGGPYRIGWVTILATLLVLVTLLVVFVRRPNTTNLTE